MTWGLAGKITGRNLCNRESNCTSMLMVRLACSVIGLTQFTKFLASKESKQVLRDGLEKALQERDTFWNICIMHSQQDRGSGQRHALQHQPTVGRGMRAAAEAAENGEEESAMPPAAAHENL